MSVSSSKIQPLFCKSKILLIINRNYANEIITANSKNWNIYTPDSTISMYWCLEFNGQEIPAGESLIFPGEQDRIQLWFIRIFLRVQTSILDKIIDN